MRHASVPAPERLRLTMTAASVLTTSVIMNSTKPAASRADSWAALASPKRPAISELTVDGADLEDVAA